MCAFEVEHLVHSGGRSFRYDRLAGGRLSGISLSLAPGRKTIWAAEADNQRRLDEAKAETVR